MTTKTSTTIAITFQLRLMTITIAMTNFQLRLVPTIMTKTTAITTMMTIHKLLKSSRSTRTSVHQKALSVPCSRTARTSIPITIVVWGTSEGDEIAIVPVVVSNRGSFDAQQRHSDEPVDITISVIKKGHQSK